MDIGDAGHFQFLDQRSPLQRAVCPEGGVSEDSVRRVSQVWGLPKGQKRNAGQHWAGKRPCSISESYLLIWASAQSCSVYFQPGVGSQDEDF